MHFRGLDLTSYPLGMILWELFSGKFMHFYFSIIHFSRKWPSRMNNIYAEQWPSFFRIDSIDVIILALVSRNCPTYFSRWPFFSINFQTMCFSLVFGNCQQKLIAVGNIWMMSPNNYRKKWVLETLEFLGNLAGTTQNTGVIWIIETRNGIRQNYRKKRGNAKC